VPNTVELQSTRCRHKNYIENRLEIKLFIARKSLILKQKLNAFPGALIDYLHQLQGDLVVSGSASVGSEIHQEGFDG
jgi:hypothetical protein